MNSSYSLIRYYNNSLSKENIVVGLVAISNTNVFFKYSHFKLGLISKLFKQDKNFIEFNLKKIQKHIETNLAPEDLFFDSNSLNFKNLLDRLSIYNNGMVQFDKPVSVNKHIDKNFFENFYKNFVDSEVSLKKDILKDKVFLHRIQHDFVDPLEETIDIDFTLNKDIIPSLFFNYKLNGIGANGSIYTVKCIDINSNKAIDTIRKEIAELESLNARLDIFSQDKVAQPKDNEHYLVMDSYKGIKEEYMELYETVKAQDPNHFPYKVVSSNDLSDVTKRIRGKKAGKFSELL